LRCREIQEATLIQSSTTFLLSWIYAFDSPSGLNPVEIGGILFGHDGRVVLNRSGLFRSEGFGFHPTLYVLFSLAVLSFPFFFFFHCIRFLFLGWKFLLYDVVSAESVDRYFFFVGVPRWFVPLLFHVILPFFPFLIAGAGSPPNAMSQGPRKLMVRKSHWENENRIFSFLPIHPSPSLKWPFFHVLFFSPEFPPPPQKALPRLSFR